MLKRNFFSVAFLLSIYFTGYAQLLDVNRFTGKFSSEGDITSNGVMVMDMIQKGSKIEGVATYRLNSGLLDVGLLSVNGYEKDNTGYIRFRDQEGNIIADGNLRYKDLKTLYFKQTTKSNVLPSSSYLYVLNSVDKDNPSVFSKEYTGKYSNNGDIDAIGVISFELSESGHKIEGIANYKTLDHQLDSGVLSVNGYTKDHKAYIRFRDQKGGSIADGILSKEGKRIIFSQTTKSDIVPIKAVLHKL
ncbi:hypothetical protein M2T78_16010 [Elizabethkingia ursingii]|uniref:hypothetical protein n=1 Tax=Elizabethkingia ursingii TaxID=1756150 RepID=UPI002011B53D|nr:hypothetical protein [Elizabethkingia ursingii]MCL1665772.1 hypothetical protein [Elizabethkingia ursingii]